MDAKPKKGTTTVGLIYKDGVVLASDKRASMGHLAMHKLSKVLQVTDHIALTTAGVVSDLSMLHKYLIAEMKVYALENGREPSIEVAANLLTTMLYSARQSFNPYYIQILMGGQAQDGSFKLYSHEMSGGHIEDTYTATGTGTEVALGVLDTEYKNDMSESEAVSLSVRAVNRAIRRDIGSGDGIVVSIINKNGVRFLTEQEIAKVLK